MNDQHLIQMANNIGDFFVAMPDGRQAREDLVAHIRRFWEPRMRRGLLAHIDGTGGADLQPFVLEALTAHRARLL